MLLFSFFVIMYTMAFKLNILSTVSMIPQGTQLRLYLSFIHIFLGLPGWKGYCFIIRILFMVIIFAISGKIILMFISIFLDLLLLFSYYFIFFSGTLWNNIFIIIIIIFGSNWNEFQFIMLWGHRKKRTTKSNAQDVRHLSFWLVVSLQFIFIVLLFFLLNKIIHLKIKKS